MRPSATVFRAALMRFFTKFSGSQKFLLCSVLTLAALNPVDSSRLSQAQLRIAKPTVDARSAMILDAKTGEVLFSKNPDLELPPASTTKVMTAIIALERLAPGRLIRISRHAYGMPASRAGLSLGKT